MRAVLLALAMATGAPLWAGEVRLLKDGATVAQVAIRWLLQRPAVASVLVGPRKLYQFEDAAKAVAWALSEEEMAQLCDLSAIAVPYPYEMVWRCSRPAHGQLDGKLWPRGAL